MAILPKKYRNGRCIHGHEIRGQEDMSKQGTCKACIRAYRSYKGNPKNGDKTHCPKGHPYSEENTVLSRRGRHYKRVCLTCKRASARRYYEARVKALHPMKPGRPREVKD